MICKFSNDQDLFFYWKENLVNWSFSSDHIVDWFDQNSISSVNSSDFSSKIIWSLRDRLFNKSKLTSRFSKTKNEMKKFFLSAILWTNSQKISYLQFFRSTNSNLWTWTVRLWSNRVDDVKFQIVNSVFTLFSLVYYFFDRHQDLSTCSWFDLIGARSSNTDGTGNWSARWWKSFDQ